MPRGRPQASWLHQMESYLKDTDTEAEEVPSQGGRGDAPSGICFHT